MKNYRILRLAGLHYADTVRSFLKQHPDYTRKSYDNQLWCLFQESPIYSDGFSRTFRNLGQESFELLFDFEILQKQWAKENGIQYTSENWMFDIMMAQIEVLKPDVIFFQGTELAIPARFSKDRTGLNLVEILRNKFPFVRLFLMFSGYPSGTERIKGIDILFAASPSLMELYQRMGFNPILLYHSFDESIINKLDNVGKQYGFTFVGSTRAPESRYWALKHLLEETDLEMWINENEKANKKNLKIFPNGKQLLRSAIKNGLCVLNTDLLKKYAESNYLPQKLLNIMDEIIQEEYVKIEFHFGKMPKQSSLREMYPERCHSPLMGMDMYNLLHQSKVTFNKHADVRRWSVGNMRMFEATGVGTCLITDTGKNMTDLFEADKEVVTYASIDEAIEKVNYLMEHENQRQEIAAAGQRRTLFDHTPMSRCMQIDEILQKQL